MSIEREVDAYNAGARGGAPIGVAPEHLAAYQAGLQAHRAGGGGAGAGGGLLLISFLLALPFIFIIGTCVYPLPGLLTLVGGALISDFIPQNGVFFLLILALPCIVIFMLGVKLEKRLEQRAGYRLIRHVARILVVGFVAHVIAFSLGDAGQFAADTSLLDRLSVGHVLVVLAAMVAAHFASRRIDATLGNATGFFSRWRLRGLV